MPVTARVTLRVNDRTFIVFFDNGGNWLSVRERCKASVYCNKTRWDRYNHGQPTRGLYLRIINAANAKRINADASLEKATSNAVCYQNTTDQFHHQR